MPGDVVVVRCKDRLSNSAIEHIASVVKSRLPDNRVLVLDSGLTLDVLGPTDMAVAPGNDRAAQPQRDSHDD